MNGYLARLRTATAPALGHPVLIIESDDWGPAPEAHARALDAIRACLRKFSDSTGRHPVMTIGIVLSIPDIEKITAGSTYAARLLCEPDFRPIVQALSAGAREGVFHLQLHGMAHYWPHNLVAELHRNHAVLTLLEREPWHTEKLPSWLQSRWMDGRQLPSRPLGARDIEQAVAEEVACFRECFGTPPQVVVPPTFVWDDAVEEAYTQAGLEVLVTPGLRFPGRDAEGKLLPPDREEINGARRAGRLTTLVRDLYFEPLLGHTPEETVGKILHKWSRREPALLETHRFNFLGKDLQSSLDALRRLLEQTLEQLPQIRFLTPVELVAELHRPARVPFSTRIRTASRRLRW